MSSRVPSHTIRGATPTARARAHVAMVGVGSLLTVAHDDADRGEPGMTRIRPAGDRAGTRVAARGKGERGFDGVTSDGTVCYRP
jgi:hypothetical protein